MVQAWSIGKKFKSQPKSVSPGPGQYTSRNENGNKILPPKWTIGTSKRSDINPNRAFSPGPGNYKTLKDVNEAPKYHFGVKSVTDLDKFKKSVPGPGQYNPSSNAFSKTAFSFAGRHATQNKGNMYNPGPGTYQNKSTLSQTLGKFGTSQKGLPLASKLVISNPGPGQYPVSSTDVTIEIIIKHAMVSASNFFNLFIYVLFHLPEYVGPGFEYSISLHLLQHACNHLYPFRVLQTDVHLISSLCQPPFQGVKDKFDRG